EYQQEHQYYRGQYVGHAPLKYRINIAQNQYAGEGGGHDERNLAARLEKTDEPADEQQHDINPKNERCVILHNIGRGLSPNSPAHPSSEFRRVRTRRKPQTAGSISRNPW